MLNEIELSQKLIRFPSYSGNNPEIISFLKDYLESLNFTCNILEYEGDGSYKVNNLHAIYNPKNSAKSIYFAGHTDVVLAGDFAAWKHDPFIAKIEEGKLFGRGSSDMKCAIACFIVAVTEFLSINKNPDFGIGFLITNDEESDGINGTKKVLQWMEQNHYNISRCIVGEPTNPNKLGEMIKIGRRGSVNFNLKIDGKQGHAAYPENAINPITIIIDILKMLKSHKFDDGNDFFDPTNLEITNIVSDNFGSNVIPASAEASFNIRFNSIHNSKNIIELVDYVCKKSMSIGASYHLAQRVSGESFLSEAKDFSAIVLKSIKKICNQDAVISTSGGTSDARFIKDYCKEIIEFGLVNKTAHQIDEFSVVKEISDLKEIYLEILKTAYTISN